jgi:hypothetical protein
LRNSHVETEESINSEVRLHLEHTNRHEPSKDIAEKYAICEGLGFMADGGIWKDRGADDNKIIFVEYILPNTTKKGRRLWEDAKYFIVGKQRV